MSLKVFFMKVLFFAQAREAAGCDAYSMELTDPVTESEFWAMLVSAFPKMNSLRKSARLARHETYLQKDDRIQPADEIAVIPPVSGG